MVSVITDLLLILAPACVTVVCGGEGMCAWGQQVGGCGVVLGIKVKIFDACCTQKLIRMFIMGIVRIESVTVLEKSRDSGYYIDAT